MLNIPEVIKELFMQDGIRKNFRVHFPNGERADLVNKDIIEESVKFTESTCSQQTLRFGLTEASVIEFECVGVENIAGMTIECGIEIDVSSLSREDRENYGTWTEDVSFPFFRVPYGVFVVDKCPRQADMKRRKVTGYTEAGVAGVSVGIAGKNNTIPLSPSALIEASWMKIDEMKAVDDSEEQVDGANNSGGYSLYLAGTDITIRRKSAVIYDGTVGGISDINAKIAIYIETNNAGIDDMIPIVSERLMARIPSGYTRGRRNVGQTVAGNSQQGFYGYSGGLYTSATLVTTGINATSLSAPVILKNNAVNVVDLKAMRATPVYGNVIQDADVIDIELRIGIITRMPRLFSWVNQGATVLVDCSDIIPEAMTRQATIYWKELNANDGAEQSFLIKADGETIIPGLGTYFEYLDDSGIRDLLDATLELRGSFGSVQRNGKTEEKTLEASGRKTIPGSLIETAWCEEYETTKPGGAIFKYKNQTEEFTGELVFRDGYLYDFTGNEALKKLADTTRQEIERLILQKFPGNTAESAYKPIDLKMKGLPWMEDGDAIRVETEDGETVDSYILRHTISGVQHLVDEIEAQGGA